MNVETNNKFRENPEVLIVGFGYVGQNLYNDIKILNPSAVDKYRPELTIDIPNVYSKSKTYDFAYICVDTPMLENGKCDVSSIYEAIEECKANIYIVKSTCPIGCLDNIKKNVIYNPEFYGSTIHYDNNYNYTILGGNKLISTKVVQLLQRVYPSKTHKFILTDIRTAQLCKYMTNCFFATKVSFMNEFFRTCKLCNINYEELRELFCLHPLISPSHTYVYEDKPYYDSYCLNKDIPSFNYQFGDLTFMKFIEKYNQKNKNEFEKGE